MARLLANLKKYFWKFVPKNFFAARQRIFWSSRKNSLQDPHLDTYWTSQNDLPNREMLISLIVNQLKVSGDSSTTTVFEFGCHCGPNLNRIRKYAADHNLGLKMYGCDINQEAAEGPVAYLFKPLIRDSHGLSDS